LSSVVSVIIPTWDRAVSLRRAVGSALAQTLPPSEVLVCDDGSTDDSEQVIAGLGEAAVRWLPGPHAGRPAIPRNRGLREAQGEWIAFLDSDDAWLPEKLALQMAAVAQTRCLASCTNAWRVTQGVQRQRYFRNAQPPILRLEHLIHANPVICSSVLMHTSLIDSVAGFPEEEELAAIEDYALWLRVAALTGFAHLDEPLVEYTDEPALSIRMPGGSEFVQRRRVLRDFLSWAQSVPGLEPHVRKAKAALRWVPLHEALRRVRQVASRGRATRP